MHFNDENNKIIAICETLSKNISLAFHDLLQDKHLYQSIKVESSFLDTETEKKQKLPIYARYLEIRNRFLKKNWKPIDGTIPLDGTIPGYETFNFQLLHIKIYCSQCDRLEAFNPQTWANNLTMPTPGNQIFMFSFMCQSCKKSPEIFLISRTVAKLTLVGRSPIEKAVVPSVISKKDHKFFSDSIVAFQSGQILAANFLLRTFIEQFLRTQSQTNVKEASQLLEEYNQQLPNDFKSRFPSLADIYSTLSADIHNATGSSELFIESQ